MVFGLQALTLVTKLLHDPTIVDATSIVGWGRNTCGPVYVNDYLGETDRGSMIFFTSGSRDDTFVSFHHQQV